MEIPKQLQIGNLALQPAVVLAPMAGVTDTVFRRFIRGLGGCGLIMTEFTSSHGVVASLNPTKNRAGNRVYRSKDIELVLLVKHLLYERKYTIEGANKRLMEMRSAGELEGERQGILSPEFLAGMKADLEALREVLMPQASRAAE